MSTVASVDYVLKRIHLSSETVGVPLDLTQVYRDVRALRASNESHRMFRPMIIAGGNIPKTSTTFTQPYVQLLHGCSIVPYDTPHSLVVIRDVFSDDNRVGIECFDRSTVSAEVDIDIQVSPVEVRQLNVSGGSGASASDIAAAVRLILAPELSRIDVRISSRSTPDDLLAIVD